MFASAMASLSQPAKVPPTAIRVAGFWSAGLSACLALAVAGCSGGSKAPAASRSSPSGADGVSISAEKVLNVYNWADFIDASVISAFEKEYGIKVNLDAYDSNEVLETKLLVGHANYDVVVPTAYYLERQIKVGVYQKLDKALLPNLANVEPEAARAVAVYDPGNQYAVPYLWLSTTGFGYDVAKIRTRLPNAPVDSWRMMFDPAVLARFQDCGVSVIDSPVNVVSAVLAFLGKDPNSESPDDLKDAERVLLSMRRYVRSIDSSRYLADLANGEICLALGWSADVVTARARAKENGKSVIIAYSIPKEGTVSNADVLAIPADAPHPRNAHLFLNYLLRPEVAARNSNYNWEATGVAAALAPLSDAVRNDPVIYPPPEVRARLVPSRSKSLQFTRLLMRTWTRFKSGR